MERNVYVVREKDGRSFWALVGKASDNRDGSMTVKLDVLPLCGTLQVMDGGSSVALEIDENHGKAGAA